MNLTSPRESTFIWLSAACQCTRVPVGAPSTTYIHVGRGPCHEYGGLWFYSLQCSLFSKEFKEFVYEGGGK